LAAAAAEARKRMRRFLRYWLPLLIWLGVIFFGSTDFMSAEHTSRFIVPFLRWLKPDISVATLASIHFVIRKCMHLNEYAILALLLLRASTCVINFKRSVWILYACVWVACFFVATTDEFHQTFVASRGASVEDVMIDGIGAFLGLLVGAVFERRHSTKLGKATASP
jgi:VanZ family protein